MSYKFPITLRKTRTYFYINFQIPSKNSRTKDHILEVLSCEMFPFCPLPQTFINNHFSYQKLFIYLPSELFINYLRNQSCLLNNQVISKVDAANFHYLYGVYPKSNVSILIVGPTILLSVFGSVGVG